MDPSYCFFLVEYFKLFYDFQFACPHLLFDFCIFLVIVSDLIRSCLLHHVRSNRNYLHRLSNQQLLLPIIHLPRLLFSKYRMCRVMIIGHFNSFIPFMSFLKKFRNILITKYFLPPACSKFSFTSLLLMPNS